MGAWGWRDGLRPGSKFARGGDVGVSGLGSWLAGAGHSEMVRPGGTGLGCVVGRGEGEREEIADPSCLRGI